MSTMEEMSLKNPLVEKSKYPRELILRYRELEKQGFFNREIVLSEVWDLEMDMVELSCGHRATVFAGATKRTCRVCLKKWLDEEEANFNKEEE